MAQLRWRWQRQSAAARPVHPCSPTDWHVVGDRERSRLAGGRASESETRCAPPIADAVSTRAWSRSLDLSIPYLSIRQAVRRTIVEVVGVACVLCDHYTLGRA